MKVNASLTPRSIGLGFSVSWLVFFRGVTLHLLVLRVTVRLDPPKRSSLRMVITAPPPMGSPPPEPERTIGRYARAAQAERKP